MKTDFIYTGIHVTKLEPAIKFYTKELGMKVLFKTNISETGGRVAWLKCPGSKQVLELNEYPKGYKYGGKSGLDHLAFKTKDAREAYYEITKRYKGAMEPFREGNWILSYVKDPDGNWIELADTSPKENRKRKKKRG
ncbi:MAG: VOC family protein [Nitrososphaerota archaeon]|nr:VOC family protein [Nitrososphaerota archaeon]